MWPDRAVVAHTLLERLYNRLELFSSSNSRRHLLREASSPANFAATLIVWHRGSSTA